MEVYVIDTNLATLVLDGELWSREPATLMRARPELLVAYWQAKEDLERVTFFYEPLRRSKVAAEWLKRETPQLVLPLTVQTELSIAEQVSANT